MREILHGVLVHAWRIIHSLRFGVIPSITLCVHIAVVWGIAIVVRRMIVCLGLMLSV